MSLIAQGLSVQLGSDTYSGDDRASVAQEVLLKNIWIRPRDFMGDMFLARMIPLLLMQHLYMGSGRF